jgi:hypothetical protein
MTRCEQEVERTKSAIVGFSCSVMGASVQMEANDQPGRVLAVRWSEKGAHQLVSFASLPFGKSRNGVRGKAPQLNS